jgi:DNA polymerase I-like protein with 3'-5' exonuclease and polymerase domains
MAQSTPRERWEGWPHSLTAKVEEIIGPFPQVSIFDCPESESVPYAIQDACSTNALYSNYLLPEIQSRKLMDLWKMDMGVVPMCARMQKVGMLLDLPHFAWLSGYLQEEMDAVLAKIKPLAGDINPESSDEVAELLFEKWEIQRGSGIRLKRTPKLGRGKVHHPLAYTPYSRAARACVEGILRRP